MTPTTRARAGASTATRPEVQRALIFKNSGSGCPDTATRTRKRSVRNDPLAGSVESARASSATSFCADFSFSSAPETCSAACVLCARKSSIFFCARCATCDFCCFYGFPGLCSPEICWPSTSSRVTSSNWVSVWLCRSRASESSFFSLSSPPRSSRSLYSFGCTSPPKTTGESGNSSAADTNTSSHFPPSFSPDSASPAPRRRSRSFALPSSRRAVKAAFDSKRSEIFGAQRG